MEDRPSTKRLISELRKHVTLKKEEDSSMLAQLYRELVALDKENKELRRIVAENEPQDGIDDAEALL